MSNQKKLQKYISAVNLEEGHKLNISGNEVKVVKLTRSKSGPVAECSDGIFRFYQDKDQVSIFIGSFETGSRW